MLTLKRSNLASFILRERETLTNVWDSLYLAQSQRNAAFPPFMIAIEPTFIFNAVKGIDDVIVNENVSEELLVAHERETAKWEMERDACQDVLVRLNKYFETIQEMADLEVSDPNDR